MPRATGLPELIPDINEQCEKLRNIHDNYGIEATKELRKRLNEMAQVVEAELEVYRSARTSNGQSHAYLPERLIKILIRGAAHDTQRYFSQFAGLFRRSWRDDDVVPSSYDLALSCMEVLYFRLQLKEAASTTVEDTIYHAWLGILITS